MEISIFQNPSDMRQMPERKHGSLKNVTILGFGSSNSMVELACHVLENATSLESMALDTIYDNLYGKANIGRCCTTSAADGDEIGRRCVLLSRELILQAHSGLQAIESYVRRKVPDEVDLTVHGPCTQCHALDDLDE
ncbi:hypothetical protein GUJ93_ZPchr0009g1418 [Zizania palustris]|uniref:At1g61320/AtMIF1 LRR domain-containing protein n=1 Tax=Zizania palustris TaxID=103762 RepID=A0A8J5RQQ6_ZIZPA|nr:hypothetical protein GUJ93_ZPchr0009g1418 [Zizania palustris]